MSGVITTGNHPKALWPGVHAWFGAKYAEHPVEYTQIFDVREASQRNYEEIVSQTGYGLVPVKTEGEGTKYDSKAQGYTTRFSHVAYSLGYVVTREALADNLYTEVSLGGAEDLAFSLRQTEENVGANVLNRAHTSGYTGGDGKVLCATDHPLAIGGTWSNMITAADFSEASSEDLAIQIMSAVNPRGMKVSIMPQRLIMPVQLVFEAERVLKSQLQNDTANNAINALASKGVFPTVAVNHYLTDSDAFFVKTNAPRGMTWFDREAVEFKQDVDFDTDNAKAKVYRRFSCGWGDPRGMYSNGGGA
jgi:hypothetical protein